MGTTNKITISLMAMLGLVCGGTDGLMVSDGERGDTVCPAAQAHELAYRLEWNLGSAKTSTSGPGWTLVNDLGFTVKVEKAYLVNYRMGLVACEEADLMNQDIVRPYERCTAAEYSWFSLGLAYAGHPVVDDDPAMITTQYVEDFANPTPLDVGRVQVNANKYCRIHYLLARAERGAVGLPSDVALVDSTIYVSGRFSRPNSSQMQDFVVLSSLADGALRNLIHNNDAAGSAPTLINVDFEGANLRIIRDLERMWDGVDFLSMSSDQIAGKLLGNLVSHLKFEFDPTQ